MDNFIAKYYCNTSTEVLPSGSTSNLVSGHWVFTQSFLSLYSDPDLIWISTTEGSLNDIPSFTQEGNRRRKGADFDKGHQCTKWEVEGGVVYRMFTKKWGNGKAQNERLLQSLGGATHEAVAEHLCGWEQGNEARRKMGKELRSNKGIGRKVAKETGEKVRDWGDNQEGETPGRQRGTSFETRTVFMWAGGVLILLLKEVS